MIQAVDMKLFILFIFTFIAFTSAINNKNQTLNKWLEEIQYKIKEIDSSSPFYQYISAIDETCIHVKININKNGLKYLKFADAMIIIYGAGLECYSDSNKRNVWKLMQEYLINSYKESIDSKYLDCFKMKLKIIEPDNYFSKDTYKILPDDIKSCKSIIDDEGFYKHVENIEKEFGNIEFLTCNAINATEFRKLFLHIVILSGENEPHYNLKYRLARSFQTKLTSAFNCAMKRIETYTITEDLSISRTDDGQVTVKPQLESSTSTPFVVHETTQTTFQPTVQFTGMNNGGIVAAQNSQSFASAHAHSYAFSSGPGYSHGNTIVHDASKNQHIKTVFPHQNWQNPSQFQNNFGRNYGPYFNQQFLPNLYGQYNGQYSG